MNMSVVILPNAKKYIKLLASLQMSFALHCGHTNQLAFCVSPHTAIVFDESALGLLKFT